jgi:hypothetical protein
MTDDTPATSKAGRASSAENETTLAQIGSLNEKPLHAGLKDWYAGPGDQIEVKVDGYVIDIVRDRLLIEIQTGSFSSIKRKLLDLVSRHRIRLVYPIAREKWIVKLSGKDQCRVSRRRSPKRGAFHHLFAELVSFPALIADPNFTIEVLLIQEEEIRRHVPGRAWRRRGWVTHERRLLEVVDQRCFRGPADLAAFLRPDLPSMFTTSDLAASLGVTRRLAQQTAYCLREMAAIAPVGKKGNAILYAREPDAVR